MVLAENALLLALGLGIGAISALASVSPHVLKAPGAVEWGSLALTLVVVAIVGMISGVAAVLAAVRAPLLGSLRSS